MLAETRQTTCARAPWRHDDGVRAGRGRASILIRPPGHRAAAALIVPPSPHRYRSALGERSGGAGPAAQRSIRRHRSGASARVCSCSMALPAGSCFSESHGPSSRSFRTLIGAAPRTRDAAADAGRSVWTAAANKYPPKSGVRADFIYRIGAKEKQSTCCRTTASRRRCVRGFVEAAPLSSQSLRSRPPGMLSDYGVTVGV